MLSWKEYPKTIGGLTKYYAWFKEYRRPRDLNEISKTNSSVSEISLFGSSYK
jgi:hypothetical protein